MPKLTPFAKSLLKAALALALLVAIAFLAGCAPSEPEVSQTRGTRMGQMPQRPQQKLASPRLNAPVPPGGGTGAPLAPRATEVALLLPLSGPQASLGQAMLQAAQLAASELADDSFTILPRDTVAMGAQHAAEDAVSNGAQLIIGPLFAAEVRAAAPVALGAHVPLLALSNDTSLAQRGVYVMGFWPGEQVRRALSTATQQGMTRWAALLPEGAYGDAISDAMQDALRTTRGASIATTLRYKGAPDMKNAVAHLAAYQGQFDALVVAEGGPALAPLLSELAANGIGQQSRVTLIGTGLWDGASLPDNALMANALYAAPDPRARADFTARYQRVFGDEPPRLTSLAYDATALAAILARRGLGYDEPQLTMASGFAGIDGLFRLKPDGRVERGLAVMTIGPQGSGSGGARIATPAPTRFED